MNLCAYVSSGFRPGVKENGFVVKDTVAYKHL